MLKKHLKWVGTGVLAVVVVGGGWCLGSQGKEAHDQRLQVAATFFPLADWARTVGFDEVSVRQIVQDGVEPHEYEPTPSDVEYILSADVVLINGGGVDRWAEDLIPEIEATGAKVVLMSDVVPFIEAHEEEEEEAHEEGHDHEGGLDPHAWLDMARVEEMVRAIAEAFIMKDEAHIAIYATNAEKFREKLGELDKKFSDTLTACKENTILVAHDAFTYWELRYGIEVASIAGISPEAEPSIQDLARLTQEAEELGIATVFFESPASTAVATTIAQEIGASIDVLYPLEGRSEEQIAAAATYTDIMELNLAALAKALTCTP